jgi:hypothetical protein
MAKIIDRLPIPARDDLAFVGTDRITLKAYEIIVWVSLSPRKDLAGEPETTRFPAILDTGHTHYFSIQERHLLRWAGLRPAALRPLGYARHSGRRVPLHAADLWLHRNVRGQRDQLRGTPQFLQIERGIAVYPDEAKFPRLPLVGLRTVLDNHLQVAVDGGRRWVNVRTPDWRTDLLRWLW